MQNITSLISEFRRQALAKLQKNKRNVIGYFCIYVPPELIEACGFIPVRLAGAAAAESPSDSESSGRTCRLFRGAGDGEAENEGEKFIHSEGCSFCKECLGLRSLKRLPHNAVEYLVVPSTCDQMKRQGDKWHHDFSVPTYHLFVPATWQDPACQEIYWNEIKWLSEELAGLSGHKPRAGTLKHIVNQYNEARKRLGRLGGYLNYQDYFALGHLFFISPVEDFLYYLGKIEKSVARPLFPRTRLMLVGSPVGTGDRFLAQALAKYPDADIVCDATCTGRRGFDISVPLSGDLIANIAAAYFTRPPCIRRRPNNQFYEYVQTLISKYRIDGIIYKTLKFCDLWKYEFKRFKDWASCPTLGIETTCGSARDAQADKRLAAFLEMIMRL